MLRPNFSFNVFLLLALLLVCESAFSFVAIEPKTTVPLQDVSVLHDPQGAFTFEELRGADLKNKFKLLAPDAGNTDFGFTTDTIWLKLPIQRSEESEQDWVLEIPYLGLDSVTLFNPDGRAFQVGGALFESRKSLFQRFDAFPLALSTTSQDFYLRVQSQYPISIPLVLWQIPAYSEAKLKENFTQALYFGGVIALVLYNLMLFISLRERRYLLYVMFASFMGLGMFAGNGYGRLMLWPNSPGWNSISQTVFIALAAWFSLLFVQEYLGTKKTLPMLHKCLFVVSASFLLLAILLCLSIATSSHNQLLFKIFMSIAATSVPLIFFACIKKIWLGDRSAKYLLIAFGTIWVGGLIASLRAFNLVPTNGFTAYSLQIGSAFEMLLLSFALANQIRTERNLRKEAEELHSQYIRFSALVSHEFRTPLNVIESQAALLEREEKKGLNNLQVRTHAIMSAVQHLSYLFTRWSQADRLKNAMTQINPAEIDLYTWLGVVIDRCRQFYSKHSIELEVDSATQLVRADKELLQIALMNLIDNACKYSASGTVIHVGTCVRGAETGIFVSDTGCGIDIKQQNSIFEEYTRLEEAINVSGIGLGLAFVKKIMNLHSGSVELTSLPGEGSTFTLWFSKSSSD